MFHLHQQNHFGFFVCGRTKLVVDLWEASLHQMPWGLILQQSGTVTMNRTLTEWQQYLSRVLHLISILLFEGYNGMFDETVSVVWRPIRAIHPDDPKFIWNQWRTQSRISLMCFFFFSYLMESFPNAATLLLNWCLTELFKNNNKRTEKNLGRNDDTSRNDWKWFAEEHCEPSYVL